MSPTLYKQCMGSLMSHRIQHRCTGCEIGPLVYFPYPRRLKKTNHLQLCLQRQHFLPSFFKTLSVGPDRVWTCKQPPARQIGTYPIEAVVYTCWSKLWCSESHPSTVWVQQTNNNYFIAAFRCILPSLSLPLPLSPSSSPSEIIFVSSQLSVCFIILHVQCR